MTMSASGELVPAGISGDYSHEAALRYPRMSSPELGRVAYFSELADRFASGAITKEEEDELIAYLQGNAAHSNL